MTNLLDLGFEQKGSFKAIDEGIYDAVIHGIVHLGIHPQLDDPKTKKPKPPKGKIKVIFELPDVIRDDGETGLISKDIRLTSGEKGDYFKLFAACLGNKVTEEQVISTDLEELLGSKLAVTVEQWNNKKLNKSGSKVPQDAMNFLDPRLAAVAKPATRPTFLFSPLKPDLEVFKNTLTYWTQKTVMEALNSDTYPKELHAAWVTIQESIEDTADTVSSFKGTNTEAIE